MPRDLYYSQSLVRTSPAWLTPVLLLLLSVALTVPWSYYIVQTAYDRDVEQNAIMLASRIAGIITSAYPVAARGLFAQQTLKAELFADPAVEVAVYCDLTPWPARDPYILNIQRNPDEPAPTLTLDQIRSFARRQVTRFEEDGRVKMAVPNIRDGKLVGFTYVEFSKAGLRAEFWQKEGPLLTRIFYQTAAGTFFLFSLALFAWRYRLEVETTRARAELQQQGLLAERGLTAAVLAHEIRNPLAALRFQLHSLRKASDPDRVNTAADTIDSELLRIQQLVTDYLEHEKAATLRTQAVDLVEASKQLQTILGELLKSTSTKFAIETPSPSAALYVLCDPHALRQVLMNLALNAQQAMGQGGSITVRFATADTTATLSLTDTGPGIPEAIKDNLFKPFQSTKAEGTGIGLALAKRFADNFGGTITVDSTPGGTTFHLTLPLASPATAAAPARPLAYELRQPQT